jgi:hypothetical protein
LPIPSQPLPFRLHRCHEYSKFVGEFVQVPRLPVSVCPSCAVPLIVGFAVFTGGFLARAAAGWTGPKAAETARVVPPAFFASTWKRMVWPTSAESSEYAEAWAPEIGPQVPPARSQRSHV